MEIGHPELASPRANTSSFMRCKQRCCDLNVGIQHRIATRNLDRCLPSHDNVANRFCLLPWVANVKLILPHKWPALPTWGSFALEPLMCRSYTDIRPLSHSTTSGFLICLNGLNWQLFREKKNKEVTEIRAETLLFASPAIHSPFNIMSRVNH
jgi:hypothetical protein